MSTTKPPNEADIIFNRANIALARSQRLVASWLPPRTTSEQSNELGGNKDDEKDDDEIFVAVPERLGLGAPIPVKDAFNSLNTGNTTTNKLDDKLRQRLLGRNAKKIMQQQQKQKQQAALSRGKTGESEDKNGKEEVVEDDDDDEEEGRTSLGKKKQPKQTLRTESEVNGIVTDNTPDIDETNINDTETQIPTIPTIPASNKRKKTAKVSYLDEILQDRRKKKKKRND
ncbi:conserved hypothetical protein [Talaromyces stipitatus ATCC 10500]|uniref:Uncharacterized protein n=1 Tax=Talaromyces stipitatus (strain ATCC 10500 / CBS 375.48 / QM 6759 / NRRL 1006) TaxID=441959 RepID=B8MA35_TALSN|nr:uncharacterized protein TSTA_121080 [Talaromyces stipitatus ATCC 10500]EED18364.1 conserved hypothetical protein [Talaromyces stipitatus ATCC 10500]